MLQDEPELEHVFVKKAVTLAMDRHDREREMTSVLLSSLYGEVTSRLSNATTGSSPRGILSRCLRLHVGAVCVHCPARSRAGHTSVCAGHLAAADAEGLPRCGECTRGPEGEPLKTKHVSMINDMLDDYMTSSCRCRCWFV